MVSTLSEYKHSEIQSLPARHQVQRPEVYSTTPHIQRKVNVHPNRSCVLCGRPSAHMSHYSVFGDNEREFVNKHANTEPAPDSCICKAHLIEAKRMCGNLDFIPKWKSRDKVNTNMKHRCLFSDCQETDKNNTLSHQGLFMQKRLPNESVWVQEKMWTRMPVPRL